MQSSTIARQSAFYGVRKGLRKCSLGIGLLVILMDNMMRPHVLWRRSVARIAPKLRRSAAQRLVVHKWRVAHLFVVRRKGGWGDGRPHRIRTRPKVVGTNARAVSATFAAILRRTTAHDCSVSSFEAEQRQKYCVRKRAKRFRGAAQKPPMQNWQFCALCVRRRRKKQYHL